MKNTSINLISRQLFLISLLAILPVGCATENQKSVTEKNEISPPKNEIDRAEENNQIPPIQEIAIERSVELTNIENIIYFDFDRADLSPEAKANLRQIAPKILNSDRNITIAGHADEIGSHKYNLDLGVRRAEAVKEFLVSLGVNSVQLSIISYGETNPIATGSNPKVRAQNRRVEFITIDPFANN